MAQSAKGRLAETGIRAGGACLPTSVGPLFFRQKVAQSAKGRLAGPLFLQSGVPTKRRLARLAAAALTAGAAAAGAVGCGGPHPRPAALRLERADLALVAHTLQQLEAPTHSEVAAARAAWPALAGGLPRNPSSATRLAVLTAERRAGALALPGYVTSETGSLTGPATTLGGLLKAYATLTPRGWRFVAAALATESTAAAQGGRAGRATGGTAGHGGGKTGAAGAPSARSGGQTGAARTSSGRSSGRTGAAGTSSGGQTTRRSGRTATAATRFLRANAGLYIYCIYDGHYDLSLIGKALQDAYRKLGGPHAFGRSLTQRQVEALVRAYSIPATRLAPHPPSGLAV